MSQSDFQLVVSRNRHKKRRPSDSSPDIEPQSPIIRKTLLKEKNMSKFLIIKNIEADKTLKAVNPFLIHRAISKITKYQLETIKKLSNGNILVEVANDTEANLLKGLNTFDEVKGETGLIFQHKVVVEDHPTLNLTRGVVRCNDLRGMSD